MMRSACTPSARRRQRGEMTLARIVLVCLILILMLVVPLMWWKSSHEKARQLDMAKQAAAPTPAVEAAPAPRRNDPNRFGLTFGWGTTPTSDRLHATCHGQPRDVITNPHRDSCNPYKGDTSCRTELPVLCSRDVEDPHGFALATASGVAGFLLTSRDEGDRRCARELGQGWRMATFHDSGGWEMNGRKLDGASADVARRAWVAIGDQPGNCWNAP
jgi:hypothetical protein